uniref:GM01028p n=1 Tax=Drosophila melanogaster TaxID=7227 RepID=Q8MT01_DROME|nr:GM01028p [Drosophila melanogaster]
MQPLNSSIDKAKHFFIESGILGPVNFKYSHDMIRKTSTIHIDETLKNQVRVDNLIPNEYTFTPMLTIIGV